jgi:hypothetical protein
MGAAPAPSAGSIDLKGRDRILTSRKSSYDSFAELRMRALKRRVCALGLLAGCLTLLAGAFKVMLHFLEA